MLFCSSAWTCFCAEQFRILTTALCRNDPPTPEKASRLICGVLTLYLCPWQVWNPGYWNVELNWVATCLCHVGEEKKKKKDLENSTLLTTAMSALQMAPPQRMYYLERTNSSVPSMTKKEPGK